MKLVTLEQREKCDNCIYRNNDDACLLITNYGTPTPCDYIVLCGSFKNKYGEKKIKDDSNV